MPTSPPLLPFSAVRNSELFSNHWLEHRLPLEPEWTELRQEAKDVLDSVLTLWKEQKPRVEQYHSEQQLEYAFIQPVFEKLGWKLIYQTSLRNRKPDYALFESDSALDAALAAGRNDESFWNHPSLVADAKAWHIPLDRPTIVNQKKEYPPEQIDSYLDKSKRAYGILTNGKLWRLVPRDLEAGQPRFQTYLECDLPKLLNQILSQRDTSLFTPQFDDFLKFYLFFSPISFREVAERSTLAFRARTGSNDYRLGVGEGLKQRVFDALGLCIEGFLSHSPNNLLPDRDIEECRQESFTLLYRLLFILFAEDRKLLPYRTHRTYTSNRSLGRFRDEVATTIDRFKEGRAQNYGPTEVALWPDLLTLFDLINGGMSSYKVPAYNGGLFNAELHPFLGQKVLPDRYLARVIDQLSRAPDPKRPDAGLFRVDYRDLAIQHLGNVYEGLLELRPHYAHEEMIVVRNTESNREEETVHPASQPLPKGYEFADRTYAKGSVYLLTDKGERRASGSYYTPDHIVDHLVQGTLGPICERLDRALLSEIETVENALEESPGDQEQESADRLAFLRGDFDDRLLRLRVLDPAMGSGHFLIRACQYLAEQIATNPNARDPVSDGMNGEEPTLLFWKRRVVENCLFGVDRNRMAVELAKLALWLETVAVDQPLTFLDLHLRHGDSLVGADISDLGKLPDAGELLTNAFERQVQAKLPTLLATLTLIKKTPSDTIKQVKEKERLFQRQFEPVRNPLLRVADVWCSTFFLPPQLVVSLDDYSTLLANLDRPLKLKALLDQELCAASIRTCGPNGVAAFHWELEFPEVFFDELGRRADGGFDAIIGNPPYDVLADRETGHDLSAVRAFLRSKPVFEPSFSDKNNLYKLFICRAVGLLTDGGRLGFITPMAVLGDKQARGIRRLLLNSGGFEVIDAFPQKDNPSKRVFREAKTSTAAFVFVKSSDPALRARPFVSRLHSANTVDESSPRLTLITADIPLYDPSYYAIVSCTQGDWELAKKIAQSGRMDRLERFAEFFQGEVNETNARKKGHLTTDPSEGALVTRGASICLYASRPASQGDDIYLKVEKFKERKPRRGQQEVDEEEERKADHHRHRRVALQESSPQNNFRRIISCIVEKGEFCNHTINYAPEHRVSLPLPFVMALLNSKLADWWFRLGSTNAHVSQYQLNILPCPTFLKDATASEKETMDAAMSAMGSGRSSSVPNILSGCVREPPFSPIVRDVIVAAAEKISAIEAERLMASRSARSALASESQEYQDLIDALFYSMAGLSGDEVKALEERLEVML